VAGSGRMRDSDSGSSSSATNVEDFRAAFGADPGRLVGVGIMTDTDNHRGAHRGVLRRHRAEPRAPEGCTEGGRLTLPPAFVMIPGCPRNIAPQGEKMRRLAVTALAALASPRRGRS